MNSAKEVGKNEMEEIFTDLKGMRNIENKQLSLSLDVTQIANGFGNIAYLGI